MKKITLCLYGTPILCSQLTNAQENPWTPGRPDGHAPINVMGDHYHGKGEWMFSFRSMIMNMEDVLSGTENVGNNIVHQKYMVAPEKMKMEMKMLGIMYAFSDELTLMLMSNYSSISMDLISRMNASFTTESDGFGDLSISALYKICNQNRKSIHLQTGISIPTGSIDQKDDTPMMDNAPLAYPMQLGSGTWDPFIGITYLRQSSFLSWGWQMNYRMRMSENKNDYRLGNYFQGLGWGAVKLSEKWSVAASLKYLNQGEIKGKYAALDPMMMPMFNTSNSGGNQWSLGFSTNFYIPQGTFKNFRIGASYEMPIYQNVSGIQMVESNVLTLGIQYSFKASKNRQE